MRIQFEDPGNTVHDSLYTLAVYFDVHILCKQSRILVRAVVYISVSKHKYGNVFSRNN